MKGIRGLGAASCFVAVGLLAGCADLADVPTDQCGNGVVDRGEDCDEPADAGAQAGGTCGQKGTDGAAACHWRCPGGTGCPTDDRWLCGADAVCRRPTVPPTWTQAATQVAEGRCEDLIAADLDTDGITDVVAVSPPTVSVHYFEKGRSLPTPGGSLIVSQSTHPAYGVMKESTGVPGEDYLSVPSLALDLSGGLAVFLASTDRAITPAAYASVSLPTERLRVSPYLFFGPGLVPLGTGFFAYNDTTILSIVEGSPVSIFASLMAGDVRTGDGVVARFANLPCEQIAVPFNRAGRGHVAVLAPCNGNGDPVPKADVLADVMLPLGVRTCVDSGVDAPPGMPNQRCQPLHAVDIDHNTWPDLVVTGEDGHLYLAFGDGTGSFAPAADAPAVNVISAAYQTPGLSHGPPLAVADLNGDCALDVVDAQSIWMSNAQYMGNCPPSGVAVATGYTDFAAYQDTHHWTEARVTDMNHDGVPDLVVASSFDAGITLFAGTKSTLFNPFSIVTTAPVKDLAPGDFDGDGVTDLAFAEIGDSAPGGLTYDTLLVSFGAPSGAPSEPLPVAEIIGVSQIVASNEQAVYPDAIRDLFVSSFEDMGDAKATSIYLFPGDSSRQIEAPYYLIQSSGALSGDQNVDIPGRAVVGRFSGDPTYPDIAVFSHTFLCSGDPSLCGGGLWLLPTGDAASIATLVGTGPGVPTRSKALPDEVVATDDALLANLGPDGAGADRLVIVLPGGNKSAAVLTATVADGGLAVKDASPLPTIAGLDVSAPGGKLDAHLVTADVDGDGHLDLIVLAPGKAVAVVPWNGAAGKLDVGAAKVLTSDDLKAAGCRSGAPIEKGQPSLGAAALRPDADGKQALVVIQPDSALLLTWASGAPSLSCLGGGEYGDPIEGGFSVATGDFDGDGLEDIVVSQRNGLAVYYGLARESVGDEQADAAETIQGGTK